MLFRSSIVGNISQNEALDAFKGLIERWQVKDSEIPEYDIPDPNQSAKVYFVDVPNAKQSEIRIGYLGLPRTHPDFYETTIMNMKLGGNFSGDVNLILREEKGFTYCARTRFSGSRFPGTFTASSGVR